MARRPLLPARTAPALQRAALLALLAFLPTGCGFWRTVPVTTIERGEEKVEGVELRFKLKGDPREWHLQVQRVELPFVEGSVRADASKPGSDAPGGPAYLYSPDFSQVAPAPGATAAQRSDPFPAVAEAPRRVDLRTLEQAEIYSPGRGFMYTVGGTLLVLAFLALVVALAKTSCPFVYVDGPDGPVFAGEAYSGATSKAIQRDDLLPLPPLTGPVARLRLANEARETQLTDRLELVLVDHAPGGRALATHEARAVLVGDPVAALEVRDLDGADVTGLVRSDDQASWATDLEAASTRRPAPAREGLTATFPALPAGSRPVLELRAGNTPFLDVVFSRFYALAGDRLGELQEWGADPGKAGEIRDWRVREGVDLLVEAWRGGKWVKVAVVPTPGPATMRTLAVPLPPFEEGAPARVRVSGGVGFWTIDRIGLSSLQDGALRIQRLAPASALDAAGDARAALAATDGRYHVLPDAGAVLPLTFTLPPLAPGAVRDAFLDTSGYYLLHAPPQATPSVVTLGRLWNEAGALGRFSLDLYRGYRTALALAPPQAP
jgi:hypothetical protein